MNNFQRRMKRLALGCVAGIGLIGVSLISVPAVAATDPAPDGFKEWLDGVALEAEQRGIDRTKVDQGLASTTFINRVIELDRRQPEFQLTFWRYLTGAVNAKRIKRGRELLKTHAKLLGEIEQKYGVQPRFLVAFWGLESNFGDYTGVFPVLGSLATLGFDPRRSKFFREQLLAALEVMANGDIPFYVKGSWAGAMGNTQFIPTTYRAYAVDGDGDGKRDLWGSLPDVFASSANYLAKSGWQGDRTWGREVSLPDGFDFNLTGLDTRKSMAEWQALGVRKAGGGQLPAVEIEGSVLLPAGAAGPAFLVYKNYRTILIWNRSILYAIAVGHLADRIAGLGPLVAKAPANEVALARRDIKEIQYLLTKLGFDTKGADGVAGPNTRRAIKAFQKQALLPADGFPNAALLERLRGVDRKRRQGG